MTAASSLHALLPKQVLLVKRGPHCYRACTCDCQACSLVQGALLSLGALAELGSTLGSNLSEYVPKVLPVLFRELRCDDPGNRRNAAFCAGVFCQHAPQQMQSQIGQLLQVQKTHQAVFAALLVASAAQGHHLLLTDSAMDISVLSVQLC